MSMTSEEIAAMQANSEDYANAPPLVLASHVQTLLAEVLALTAAAALAGEREGELQSQIETLQERVSALMGELSNEEPRQVAEHAARFAKGIDPQIVIRDAVAEYKAHFNLSCEFREQDQRKLREVEAEVAALTARLSAAEAERDECRKWLNVMFGTACHDSATEQLEAWQARATEHHEYTVSLESSLSAITTLLDSAIPKIGYAGDDLGAKELTAVERVQALVERHKELIAEIRACINMPHAISEILDAATLAAA